MHTDTHLGSLAYPATSDGYQSRLNSPDYLPCKNKSQFCIGLPSNCIEAENCAVLFKSYVSPSSNYMFNFELIGYDIPTTEGKYVAVGFSDDQQMGDDLVFSCLKLKNDQRVKFEVSENVGNINRVLPYPAYQEVQPLQYRTDNGKISCKWELKYDTTINNKHYNFYNNYYYILLAKGNLESNSGI